MLIKTRSYQLHSGLRILEMRLVANPNERAFLSGPDPEAIATPKPPLDQRIVLVDRVYGNTIRLADLLHDDGVKIALAEDQGQAEVEAEFDHAWSTIPRRQAPRHVEPLELIEANAVVVQIGHVLDRLDKHQHERRRWGPS